jgi:hypothetical protein
MLVQRPGPTLWYILHSVTGPDMLFLLRHSMQLSYNFFLFAKCPLTKWRALPEHFLSIHLQVESTSWASSNQHIQFPVRVRRHWTNKIDGVWVHICLHYLRKQGLHYFILLPPFWNKSYVWWNFSQSAPNKLTCCHKQCKMLLLMKLPSQITV